MSQTIGVVGLGNMGGAMAANLLAAGFAVVGCDPSPEASGIAARKGVEIADTPAEVAKRASAVILSLPSGAALDSVVREIGAAPEVRNTILLEMSTLSLADKQAARELLAQNGNILLDAPVSGTGAQARTGDLVVLASGDRAAFDACLPALKAISRRQNYVGEFGAGMQLKLIANHLVTIHNVAAGEAFALANKVGLDLQMVYEVIGDSAGTSRMFQVRGPQMVRGRYDNPTATVRIHLKDLNLIRSFAGDVGFPLPLFSSAAEHYRLASEAGLDYADTACVCAVAERLGGLER